MLIDPISRDQQANIYDEIFSALPEHIFILDRLGHYLYANRSGAEAFGLEQTDMVGKTWRELSLPPDVMEPFESKLKEVFATGKTLALVIKAPTVYGITDYEYTLSPLYREDGNVISVLVTMRDITNKKQAEEKLRRSEERLRAIIDNTSAAIYVKDKEGRYILINRQFEDLFHITREAIKGKTDYDVFPKERADALRINDQEVLEIGASHEFEEVVPHEDGPHTYISIKFPLRDSRGVIYGIGGISTDITERKRAEEALRTSEERFRKVFEEGPLGMAIADLDFRFIKVNARLCQMLGYTEEELTQLAFPDITYPEDIDKDVSLAKKLFSGEIPFFQIEKRYVKKNGEVFWIGLTASIIHDEKGDPLYGLGMIEDISERKRVEEALCKSEARYRTLIEQIPAVTYIASFDDPSVTLYVSPQIETLLGYPHDKFRGDPDFWPRHLHPDDRRQAIAKMAHSRTNGEPLVLEYRMLARDGSVKWFRDEALLVRDEAGTPLFFQGVMLDITERKQMEEALRESEARYRTLFENAGDAIFILDAEGGNAGQIVSANQAAAEMHGYTVDELLALNIKDLDTPDAAKEAPGRIRSILGGELVKLELTHRKKDGTVFPVEIHASLLELENHKYILAFDRDITEGKRAKELSDALNNINAVMNSTLNSEKIMQEVVIESTRAIGAEGGVILLRKGDRWVVSCTYGFSEEIIGTRLTSNEAKHAAIATRTREPVIIGDTSSDERVNREVMERYGIRSLLTVPLMIREDVIGALCFCYRSKQVAFTETEVDFASKLAASVSLSLENARLYAVERNIADTLQEALLTVPQRVEGIDFGHLYRSAAEATKVGGDFYDLFELEHGKIGIIMGDVSGKGVEAATLTALVKNTLRAYALEEYSPASVMAKTNNAVAGTTAPSLFVTVFFGILDTKTGHLIYCSAGHPPAILKREAFEGIVFLATRSPIIGAFAGLNYVNDEIALGKGDALILYTDGLIEARCDGKLLGEERLVEMVKELKKVSAKEVPQTILNKTMELTNGKFSDDVAILSVSIEGELGT